MEENQQPVDQKPIVQQPAKKPVWKRWWFWAIVIIVLIIAGSGGNNNSTTTTSTNPSTGSSNMSASSQQSSPTTTQTIPPKEKYDYVCDVEGIGKVKGAYVSDVGIAIAKVETKNVIQGSFSSTKADGEFKILYVVLSNKQKDAITVDSNSFKLKDSAGREYSPSSEGSTALMFNDKETFFLKNVDPGITTGGYIVYDIPKGIQGLQLEARGGFTGETILLPLEVMKTQ